MGIGKCAKAVIAAVTTLIVGFLTKEGIVIDENAISAVVEAIVMGGLVYVVPNTDGRTRAPR